MEIVRKDIRNLHLGVYPPNGRVRVAAPLRVNDDAVRLAVVGKLGWIKRQRAGFKTQPRQSRREMVTGESHYYLGRRYRLRIVNHDGATRIEIPNRTTMEMHVRPDTNALQREAELQSWYRTQLREMIVPLLAKWQKKLDVKITGCIIRKMKTRWGACNVDARRLLLNTEMVKKPWECVEYIVVHELAHLVERHHNDRFLTLMDKHLPQWRLYRKRLNAEALSNERWDY